MLLNTIRWIHGKMPSGFGAPDSWQTVPLARLKGTLFQPYERRDSVNILIMFIYNDLMDQRGGILAGESDKYGIGPGHLQTLTRVLTAQYCSTDIGLILICAVRPSIGEFYS